MSITKEEVLKMDLKSIYAAVKDPATSAQMQQLLRDRVVVSRVSELMLEANNREEAVDAEINRTVPPSTEVLAAQAEDMAATPPAVVEPVVTPPVVEPVRKNFEAEDAPYNGLGIVVVRDSAGSPTRYIQEYQVRDEDNTAIGRPTHLEARSIPELIGKQQECHVNATRAFHRLKKQKLTFKQEPRTVLTPEAIAEAAKVALEEKDVSKASDVIHAAIEVEYGKRDRELHEKEEYQKGVGIANEFMRKHLHDYNPCEANKKAITDYFKEKNLEFTLDNVEVAFIDLMDQNKLVKVEKTFTQIPAAVTLNPAPAAAVATPAAPPIPASETTAAVPASVPPATTPVSSQPVVEATAPTPAAALNVQPAARRPGVNGSIAPGTLSAQRPGTPNPALARKEFLKTVRDMKPEEMKTKLKNDPQFVKQLESYGIKVR